MDELPGAGRFTSVMVANFSDEIETTTLAFLTPKHEKPSIFEWGQVFVDLPSDLIKQCPQDDNENNGVRQFDEKKFQILRSGARLGAFNFAPDEMYAGPLFSHGFGS